MVLYSTCTSSNIAYSIRNVWTCAAVQSRQPESSKPACLTMPRPSRPGHFEQSFNSKFLSQSLRIMKDSDSFNGGSAIYTRLTLEPVPISVPPQDQAGPDADSNNATFQSYAVASNFFSDLLVAEASARITKLVEELNIINASPGLLSQTEVKLTLTVTSSETCAGTGDAFSPVDYAITSGRGSTRSYTSDVPVAFPWRTGQVVLMRFDTEALSALARRPRGAPSHSKKRLRDDTDAFPPLPKDVVVGKARYLYRLCLATSPTRILFCFPKEWSPLGMEESSERHAHNDFETERLVSRYLTSLVPQADNGSQSSFNLDPVFGCPVKFLHVLDDVSPIIRQAEALHSLATAPENLLNFVSNPRRCWQWSLESAIPFEVESSYWSSCTQAQAVVLTTMSSRVQRRLAHVHALSGGPPGSSREGRWSDQEKSSIHNSRSLFLMVQGPPGSGKSSTIVETVKACLMEVHSKFSASEDNLKSRMGTSPSGGLKNSETFHPRFLLSAPTNDATDELLFRFNRDELFSTEVKFMHKVQRTAEFPFAEVDYPAAVSRFLVACSTIRIGAHSKDRREPVVQKSERAVVAAAISSIEESLATTTEEIERLDKVVAAIAKQELAIRSLKTAISKPSNSSDRCEMTVDGRESVVQGDLRAAVGMMNADLAELAVKLRVVRDRVATLRSERDIICDTFSSFLPGPTFDFQRQLQAVVANATCVFTTCDGAGCSLLRDAGASFDVVFIDEAARATIPEILVPVAAAQKLAPSSGGSRKYFDVCVVGDPAQNSATVISQDPRVQKFLKISVLERAMKLAEVDSRSTSSFWPPFRLHLLDKQFRMHPLISEFPRNAFYGGKLQDGREKSWFALPWHTQCASVDVGIKESGSSQYSWYGKDPNDKQLGPLLLVDTSDAKTEGRGRYSCTTSLPGFLGSLANFGEALFVSKVLAALHRTLSGDSRRGIAGDEFIDFGTLPVTGRQRKPTVLIMAPYRLQVRILKELLEIDERDGPEKKKVLSEKGWRR